MKALSISQPWSWLIVNGYKDIENRRWTTNHRGIILIHAGKRVDASFFTDGRFNRSSGKRLFLPYAERMCGATLAAQMPQTLEEYATGGIVGYAILQEVLTKSASIWHVPGQYGFVLRHQHSIDLLPLLGQLGIFDVPPEIKEHINAIRNQRAWEEDTKV